MDQTRQPGTGSLSTAATTPAGTGTMVAPRESQLITAQGRTAIADSVVSKIAGLAAREVSGVREMGKGTTRAFGTLKEKLPGTSGPSVSQGVSVEVGERQAAVDLDLVID